MTNSAGSSAVDTDSKPCPVCNSDGPPEFSTIHSKVHKCTNLACGHLFVSLPPEAMGVHEHDTENIDAFRRRDQRLISRFVSDGLLPEYCRVLDIGAGLGHISGEIRRQRPRSDIVCVEAAPQSIRHLRDHDFKVVESLSQLQEEPHGQFDLILLVEVIEHVEDPVALLKTCNRLLAKGGSIFLTTPSGELRNGSHRTAAYQASVHIQFFTQHSLRLAARSAGFTHMSLMEMYEYYSGPNLPLAKWLKDTARMLRNVLQGKHHFVCFISNEARTR